MKYLFYLLFFVSLIEFSSCTTLKEKTIITNPSFDSIEATANALDKTGRFEEEENYLRSQLIYEWGEKELSAIHYYLGRSLYFQKKYEKALQLLPVNDTKFPFYKERMILAGNAAFLTQNYSDSLDIFLKSYLYLDKETKTETSKQILFSYIHLKRWEDASKWYKNLSEDKKDAVKNDLLKMLEQAKDKKNLFFDGSDENSEENNKEEYINPEITEKDFMKLISDNYTPDWSRIAVLLPSESSWQKVSELEESFFKWYFSSKLNSVNIDIYKYTNGNDISEIFETISAKKTSIVIGAIFYDHYAKEIAEASAKLSIPVISYTSYISSHEKPLFINLKYTKEKEASDIISYLVSQGKKDFALVYPNNTEGTAEKNVFWDAIVKAGGNIKNTFSYTPDDKDIFNSVSKLAPLPDNAGAYIGKFRKENAGKFKTRTLMSRAINSFEKDIPPNIDYDTLIISGKPSDTILIINSLAYRNLEFDYKSSFEQDRIKGKNRELSSKGLPWQHKTVKIVPGSEVLSSETFISGVDKFVDAMAVSSKTVNDTETNTYLTNFKTFFANKFSRQPYQVELYLAEIADFTVQSIAKAGSGSFSEYRDKISSSKFTSLLAGKEFNINFDGSPVGLNSIYEGKKREGFIIISDKSENNSGSKE